MRRSPNFRAINQKLGAVGLGSLLVFAVAFIAVGTSVRSLGGAFFAPSAKEVKSSQDERLKQIAADYSKTLAQQTAQFNGRSVFFTPSAPPPPPPPTPPVTTEEVKAPPPPPPPAVYGGPKLIAMVNDFAWFDDGQKIEAGKEGKDGLKLTELVPPWEVAVVWKGVDFKVSLFDRDKVVYPPKAPEKPVDAPEAAAVTAKPEAGGEGSKPEGTAGSPETPKPETPASTEPKPGEPKPAEPKPAEPTPESPKPSEPKPEPAAPPAPPSPPKPDQP